MSLTDSGGGDKRPAELKIPPLLPAAFAETPPKWVLTCNRNAVKEDYSQVGTFSRWGVPSPLRRAEFSP